MDKQVAQYVTDALRLTRHLWTPGSQPSPEALAEVTEFLNQMLDSWNTMRNSIYALADLTFNLTPGQTVYTIGSGGDLNGPRPQQIEVANLIYQSSPTVQRLPIDVINVDQWAAIRLPDLQSSIPQQLYYDNGYSQTFPTGLGKIMLWPAPQSNYVLEIFIWTTLPTTLLSTDTIFAPPGYARAITYGLAAEILTLYPKRVTPEIEENIKMVAHESKTWLESLNSPSPITAIDSALLPERAAGFNWLVSTN